MKIRRYLGTDMRDALRQIRAELGNDAVILSTRPLGNGVEVSAAVDASQLQENAVTPLAASSAPPAAVAPPAILPPVAAATTVPTREQVAMSEEPIADPSFRPPSESTKPLN